MTTLIEMNHSSEDVRIRPYAPADLARVRALHDRMGPYRPEHQAEVEAMFARAEEAEHAGDRWAPVAPAAESLDTIEASYLVFWVAVANERPEASELVGMVGVRRASADTPEAAGLAIASQWQRGDVAELRRLRVAPERWRQGIGARLTETVIDWSRENGYRALILNTTSPQLPAQALYLAMGFRETARSYIGRYELVWLELLL
jgi:GNAT superfamily N-acetyltransferase